MGSLWDHLELERVLLPKLPAAWSYIPQVLSVPIVHSAAQGNGGLHPGGSPAGFHSTIHVTSYFQLLLFLLGKKDGGLRHWLPCSELPDSQVAVSTSPGPCRPHRNSVELAYSTSWTYGEHTTSIREGDEWKTAFITPSGHYEYQVMPYGLANSPSVFQSFMNEVFWEFLHRYVIVYIGVILIYSGQTSPPCEAGPQTTQEAPPLPEVRKMWVLPFHRAVPWHTCHQPWMCPGGPGDGSRITDWLLPQSVKEQQRFLEFSNFYRCFIHNFSFLKAPFTTMLCGKPKSLSWTPEAQFFSQLKKAFITTPILRHPDPQAHFCSRSGGFNHQSRGRGISM